MSDRSTVYLKNRASGQLVEAALIDGVTLQEITCVESSWRPISEHNSKGAEHSHWDWREKHEAVAGLIAYRMFGIECDALPQKSQCRRKLKAGPGGGVHMARGIRGAKIKQEYDFFKAKRGAAFKTPPGKTRITIRLDNGAMSWFREQAHASGGGSYQSLINEALVRHVGAAKEPLECTLRRVIREELHTSG